MSELGQHVLIDLIGIDRSLCLDTGRWQSVMVRASQQLGAKIIASRFHEFLPPSAPGLTAYHLLDASHISVHTYADLGKVALDVFACTELNVDQIVDDLLQAMEVNVSAIVQRLSVRRFGD